MLLTFCLCLFCSKKKQYLFRLCLVQLDQYLLNNLYMCQWCLNNQSKVLVFTESYQNFKVQAMNWKSTEDSKAKNVLISNFVSSACQSYLKLEAKQINEIFQCHAIFPKYLKMIEKASLLLKGTSLLLFFFVCVVVSMLELTYFSILPKMREICSQRKYMIHSG